MSLPNKSVKYWNDIAASSWEDARDAVLVGFRNEKSFDEAGKEDVRHLILPFISPKDSVLDIGCGLGRLVKHTAPHCHSITGIDISKEMLKMARQRLTDCPNAELLLLPASLKFPVKSSSINFAYFYHVSEHMDRENAFKILNEIHRVLKPGGKALIQFSLIDFADNQKEFLKWAKHGDEEGVRSRFYTEQEANIMLQMTRFYPQYRIYVPGEFAVVCVKKDDRLLGAMPVFPLKA